MTKSRNISGNGVYGKYGETEKSIQDFGRETKRKKKTILSALAQMSVTYYEGSSSNRMWGDFIWSCTGTRSKLL